MMMIVPRFLAFLCLLFIAMGVQLKRLCLFNIRSTPKLRFTSGLHMAMKDEEQSQQPALLEPQVQAPAAFNGYEQPKTKREAFAIAASSPIKMPCIILVNPFLSDNVGSASRAMLNFGMTELRVVDPRCDILSDQARALAAGSVEILENAKIFNTVEECVADLNRVFATTVRLRHMTQLVLTPEAAAAEAVNLPDSDDYAGSCGVMFGRERSGLSNEEVALADRIISIPTFSHFSSLNLAQAVNIVGSGMWNRYLQISEKAPPCKWLQPRDNERLARREEIDFILSRLESSLTERNYQPNPGKREIIYRNIRQIVQRTSLAKSEIELLHGVLTSLIRPVRGSDI